MEIKPTTIVYEAEEFDCVIITSRDSNVMTMLVNTEFEPFMKISGINEAELFEKFRKQYDAIS